MGRGAGGCCQERKSLRAVDIPHSASASQVKEDHEGGKGSEEGKLGQKRGQDLPYPENSILF